MSEAPEVISVLHVDDEPGFAEMVSDFLEQEAKEIKVDTATSPSVGREKLTENDYSCIVSDYDMPGQNGIEFLETVREDHPCLPFILYTGKGSEEVASDAITAGATDYLQKESGTTQYNVLTNRIQNAVEQYRAQQRATNLDRIRNLVNEINQALVRAESRADVEAEICEIISDSDPYLFAWIGGVDPDTKRIEPRAAAGIEDRYLDTITVTADESPTGQGPGGTAIREGRIAISQNIDDDPEFEPWREEAIKRGYRAVAALPLKHEETLYGELVVYANRSYAFDDAERELLIELGDNIAHAFYSLETQSNLREQREFIDQALDTLNDTFYVVGTDGTLKRWNSELSEVTGYDDDEIADMQATDFFPSDEQATIAEAIDETLTTGGVTVESRFLTADGERIPYEFTGSRLTDIDGDLIGLIGIGRDITQRKERERRLETLLDNLPGMVYRCQNEQGWPMENVRGEVEELTGYLEEEIESKGAIFGDEIIHSDDREDVWNAVQNALETGTTFDLTYRIRTKQGDTKWVRERGQGVGSENGEVEALEGFITEITDEKENQQELEAANTVLRTIVENLPMGVLVEDANREVLMANDRLSAVLDLPVSADGLVGRDCRATAREVKDLFADPDEFLYKTEQRVEECDLVQNEEFELADGRIVKRDYIPYSLPDGNAILWLYRDVTARKQHENALHRQNERLEQFSSVVSHDLRNPLNVAQGRLELASEEHESDHLDDAANAVERSLSLIDDLLALAREGERVSEPESVDLGDIIRGCWQNVETNGAALTIEIHRTIRADESRLKQLFENLLRNAVEHSEGDVTVDVGELDAERGFYVADDGPGSPEDERERIFEAGYSTNEDGTGFGLKIVQEIADAHGWNINVTDSQFGGARFEVTSVEFTDC
ncbi:hybrid sensor histidine kinase/response regulator [Haloarcula amylovorans]|uniref:hybrid sensor histidine kinase/response regulator n=1 Tax=Haloarcula amylovorans TaxID=2562280 RepID=UPI0010761F71|nr:PAS domain S-box protein [Halomicroarcula amylolytica]